MRRHRHRWTTLVSGTFPKDRTLPILKAEDEAVTTGDFHLFAAPYDRTTKVITAVVVLLGVAFVVATRSPLVAGLWLTLIVGAFAYSPRGFAIVQRCIVVRRLIGSVRIPLEQVREARPAERDDFRGCIRLWGNGGLFGYYGLFRTSRLGKCSFYITSRSSSVVVVTAAKTVVVSPDNVDGFLNAIRAAVPVPPAPASEAGLDSARSAGIGTAFGRYVGTAIGVCAIAIVAAALLYSPGPPRYMLTIDSLAIYDRFYPVTISAAAVDVDRIQIVDPDVDTGWRPTLRTNGFSNFHYHAGWYRVANGQQIRMYKADGKRLVLLPPKGEGSAVLIEVADPDRFIQEVREKWHRQ